MYWKSVFILLSACLVATGLAVMVGGTLPSEALYFVSSRDAYRLMSLELGRGLIAENRPVDFFTYSLSPDGRYLAYVKPIIYGSEIRIRDMPSGQLMRVASVEGGRLDPLVWSPDSHHVAFVGDLSQSLFILDIHTGEQRRLTESVADSRVSWSPDGRQIAFTSDQDYPPFSIHVVEVESGVVRVLGEGVAPNWSPDGRQIVFVSGRDNDLEIYRMQADGSQTHRLTQAGGTDTLPMWSPDGRYIAFESTRETGRGIYVMDADGQNPRRVSRDVVDAWAFSWSPDGEYLAFLVGVAINPQVYVARVDGSSQWRLTNDHFSYWSPQWWIAR
jgi:Tol biopolymer transport system component